MKLGGQLTSKGASPLAGSAVFFFFLPSNTLCEGVHLLNFPTDCQYLYPFSSFFFFFTRTSLEHSERREDWFHCTPPPFPFCHRKVCLVNVPSESIGLRDGGVQAVAGCRSEPSILRTWEVAGAQGGVPPACWINHRLVHSAAAVQLTKGDPVNAVRRYD